MTTTLRCGCSFEGREFSHATSCTDHADADDVLWDINGADHSNAGPEYCCPHCLESAPQANVDWTATAVECPKCKMTFAAWKDETIVYKSAKIGP